MRRLCAVFIYVVVCGLVSGCALADLGRDMVRATKNMFTPNTRDYADSDSEADQWSYVGQEARGDRPKDRESDALTQYIDSPTAQSINRNLGVY